MEGPIPHPAPALPVLATAGRHFVSLFGLCAGPIILRMTRSLANLALCSLIAALLGGGCGRYPRPWDRPLGDDLASPSGPPPAGYPDDLPKDVRVLMPKKIVIHPLTGRRTLDGDGNPSGFEVRIKALDSFGDPTKALGRFRFTLYAFRHHAANRRGDQLAVWDEDLSKARRNRRHWDPIFQTYKFDLQWDRGLSVGQVFILEAYFAGDHTEQLFDERSFSVQE